MFWLRNKKIKFLLGTLNLSPDSIYSHGPQYPPRYLGLAFLSSGGYRHGTAVAWYASSLSSIIFTISGRLADRSLCSFGSAVMLKSQRFLTGL